MRCKFYPGDCLDVLPTLPENSVDACVTDPPYHLVSIVKRFGSPTAKPVRVGDINATNDLKAAHARSAAGFMGKKWDGGELSFKPETWKQVYRVLKPGAHLLAFGGTRTFHRMACAIEDAGFEIRDTINWLYGSGFPKSHDVSKGIDKAAGAKRKVIRERYTAKRIKPGATVVREGAYGKQDVTFTATDTAPSTDEAQQWQGWGTALKPACELIVLARKPLSEKTVAANVLKWGTGALNIDGCRVGTNKRVPGSLSTTENAIYGKGLGGYCQNGTEGGHNPNIGRWPANIIHDNSDEVRSFFPETGASPPIGAMGGGSNKHSIFGEFAGERHSNGFGDSGSAARFFKSFPPGKRPRHNNDFKSVAKGHEYQHTTYGYIDTGSAARFFYSPKAGKLDRNGSKHPTVKPIKLLQYLVRLITPKNGTVIDPFAGTGTLAAAARRESAHSILIESDPAYQQDIRQRLQDLFTTGVGNVQTRIRLDPRARDRLARERADRDQTIIPWA